MQSDITSSSFEHFPAMNRIMREQLVGRVVTDLLVDRDSTLIALDNGAVLQMHGFAYEFQPAA